MVSKLITWLGHSLKLESHVESQRGTEGDSCNQQQSNAISILMPEIPVIWKQYTQFTAVRVRWNWCILTDLCFDCMQLAWVSIHCGARIKKLRDCGAETSGWMEWAPALLSLSNQSQCQPSQTDFCFPVSSLALGAVGCSAAPSLAA